MTLGDPIFLLSLKKIFVVTVAFISPFNAQTMHIKSFNTQQLGYDFLKTLHPGGIRTRVFLFLSQLRHAAKAFFYFNFLLVVMGKRSQCLLELIGVL
jgi:hypothetical protein